VVHAHARREGDGPLQRRLFDQVPFSNNEPVHVLQPIANIKQRGIRTNYLLREASDLAVRLCCAPQVLESLRILEELKMLRLQDLVFGEPVELRRN